MIQIEPSSLDIGWAPPDKSMIDSRRCPRAAGPSTVEAVAVRPAVSQRGGHSLDDCAIGRISGAIHESGDAAHEGLL